MIRLYSVGTGSIFTLPALFLWGIAPPFLQIAMRCLLGGFLGIAAMILLRRLLCRDSLIVIDPLNP